MATLATYEFGGAACALGLREEVQRTGAFYARHPLFPASRCERAIDLARGFFALPPAEKEAIHLARSRHFRGYSEMRNERDWREQVHFGREEPARSGSPYDRLRGPNLWPADVAWREEVLGLLADLETVGREILQALCYFSAEEEAYLLLKMIHYGASPADGARPGVAAHVDFSWITLLLQDEVGGLEVRTPEGEWVAVAPCPGTLVVNLGEILEFSTGGAFRATPHRVRTSSRPRISLPFFLNPALDTVVGPGGGWRPAAPVPGHVHRVYSLPPRIPVVFGEEEWRRKGENDWCAECCQTSK